MVSTKKTGKNMFKRRIRRNRFKKSTFASKVKSVIKSQKEKKYIIQGISGTISSSGSLQPLDTLIVEGDDSTQREGREIVFKSVRMLGQFAPSDDYNVLRYGIVRSKSGTITTINYFFEGGVAGVNTMLDTQKVEIIMDKYIFVNYNSWDGSTITPTYASPNVKLASHNVQINRRLQYLSSSGECNRPFYYFVISDSAAPNHPAFLGNLKLKFYDV